MISNRTQAAIIPIVTKLNSAQIELDRNPLETLSGPNMSNTLEAISAAAHGIQQAIRKQQYTQTLNPHIEDYFSK